MRAARLYGWQRWSVGPDWSISTTIRWIGITSGSDIHVPRGWILLTLVIHWLFIQHLHLVYSIQCFGLWANTSCALANVSMLTHKPKMVNMINAKFQPHRAASTALSLGPTDCAVFFSHVSLPLQFIFQFLQQWILPPVLLCIALWDKSAHKQQTLKRFF